MQQERHTLVKIHVVFNVCFFQSTHAFSGPGVFVSAAVGWDFYAHYCNPSWQPSYKGFIISQFHILFPEGPHSVQTVGQELVSFWQKLRN